MSPDVDAYLAALPEDQRVLLTALRATILAYLPQTTECLSYAMPGYRLPSPGKGRQGQVVAGFAGFANHCGFYPHSGSVIPVLQAECAGFKTSKSGVLFTPAKPLPTTLLHKIIDTRLAEVAAGYAGRPPG